MNIPIWKAPAHRTFLFAQISLLHSLIIHQFFRITAQNDIARLKHICFIGNGERFFRILLDQKNGHSVLVDFLDNIENLINIEWGQTHRRLVENDQARVAHEGASHRKHLLLAAGQSSGKLVLALFQTRETLVDHF